MGNGPSLREMDLDLLEGEVVFASNSVFLLFPQITWRPKHYSCVDTRVLPDTKMEITAMLQDNPGMQAFFPEELPQYDGSGQTIQTRGLFPPLENIHFFKQRPMIKKQLPSSAFTIGPGAVLCSPKTVTIALMQIAVIMGFSDIYLFGCDTSYTIPASVLQTGRAVPGKPGEKLLLTSTLNDDPNHFTPNYFGAGKKWHHPKTEEMIRHYKLAKEVLDSAGVAVYNATIGGELDVFPRVNYKEILKKC